jgi:hypothetical protein
VAVVPVAERPGLSVSVPVATIAARALQALGVTVPAASRPAAPLTVSVDQVAANALYMLAVMASDEPASAPDQNFADAQVLSIHDGLVDRGLVSWSALAIPQAVYQEYSQLTALHLAPAFGKQGDPSQQPVLEARIQRIALVLQAQPLAEARVNTVHDSLVAQAFVSWPVSTIPQAVSEEYVSLVAMHLGPLFGTDTDPKMIPVLEQRIRQYSVILGAVDNATGAVLAVHRNLAARGLARWSIQDIPPAAEEPYMLLTADNIAPDMGMQQIQGDAQDAYRALAQIIALPTSGERVQAEYF